MVHRLPVILLVFILCLGLALSGCGGKTETPAVDTPGQKDAAGTAAGTKDASGTDEVAAQDILNKGAGKGFTFETTVSGTGVPEAITTKTWLQGENWRTEFKGPEGMGTTVTMINGTKGVMYIYHPEQNFAQKMDLSKAMGAETEPPVEGYDPATLKYLGRDTVDGKKCVVYAVSAEGSSSKVWFWDDWGFPLRVENTFEGETVIVEYRNVQVGDIPASMFEPPAGVQLMSF